MQQVYGSISTVNVNSFAIRKVSENFDAFHNEVTRHTLRDSFPVHSNSIIFERLAITNASFKFSSSDSWLINNLSLVINSGDKVLIRGTTGSGKSTLMDLMIGLLETNLGDIKYEFFCSETGKLLNLPPSSCWQQMAYSPQKVVLKNATIAENIAFTTYTDEINFDKVVQAAKVACIHDYIQSLPDGYSTIVDEMSSLQVVVSSNLDCDHISKEPQILYLDEATNALDFETQNKVMFNLTNHLKKTTVIMITHYDGDIAGFNKEFMLSDLSPIMIYDLVVSGSASLV